MTQCPHCQQFQHNEETCAKCNKILPINQELSFFEILGLKQNVVVDMKMLDDKYIDKITLFHPDKFVTKSVKEQEIATNNAALINSAYHTLSSPILTCEYIVQQFELQHHTIISSSIDNGEDSNIWLAESMALHEELNDLSSIKQIEAFERKMLNMLHMVIKSTQNAINTNQFVAAKNNLEKIRFIERLINSAGIKASEIKKSNVKTLYK